MKKKNNIIKCCITILLLLLPILDCLRTTSVKDIDIFCISIIELPNIILIGVSLLVTLLYKSNKKSAKIFIAYTIIFITYIVLHDFNILNFDSTIYQKSSINLITETYYILRVYYLPICLLYVLYQNRDIFNFKFYLSIIKKVILLISGSIILLNILKLSYASYSAENILIKYNIFDFYKSTESYQLLSTRGLFDSANELSAILIALLPVNIYLLFKEKKFNNHILYIIQFISMIILGTKTSSLGAILLSSGAIIINIFTKVTTKQKINYRFIVIAILCSMYFFASPVGNYLLEKKYPNFISTDEHSKNLSNLTEQNDISDYINNHLYDFRINEVFVKMYPIENDYSFWKQIALGDRNKNNDSRVMKTTIISRIKERNNNKKDTFFGMGYTINFMDLERDYVYQYYLFGIIGLIVFLSPYFILLIKNTIFIIKKLHHPNSIYYLILLMSPVLTLLVAYNSGHVFGWISPSLYLIMILGLLNASTKEKI